ncbi:unnamed protein product [Schistosoma bovis]|nr:unnamed protein product [Schistosoma bovis]
MSSLKAIIKSVDMPDIMQQDAVDICAMAIKKYSMEKDIAAFMKKEFDRKYSPSWHCIVGSHFGTYPMIFYQVVCKYNFHRVNEFIKYVF